MIIQNFAKNVPKIIYIQPFLSGQFCSIPNHDPFINGNWCTFSAGKSVKSFFVTLLKGVYSRKKDFAPIGSKFFLYRTDTFSEQKKFPLAVPSPLKYIL